MTFPLNQLHKRVFYLWQSKGGRTVKSYLSFFFHFQICCRSRQMCKSSKQSHFCPFLAMHSLKSRKIYSNNYFVFLTTTFRTLFRESISKVVFSKSWLEPCFFCPFLTSAQTAALQISIKSGATIVRRPHLSSVWSLKRRDFTNPKPLSYLWKYGSLANLSFIG